MTGSSVSASPPNQELDGVTRYTFIRDLNRGAHGIVQLCLDTLTQEQVAVKFIERGDKVTHYVEREIMNHRSLNHPHIIQFKEVFLTPRHLGIVMEFAAGGDLFDYIMTRDKRLTEVRARWFFQQLIVALDYCHKMGVANRDIKLENTLLDANKPPLLKLCDFGYSKNAALHSAPHSLVGTPAYLAPEVVDCRHGTKYNGQAADVWSSGVMLYVMLVGGYPFERPGDGPDATRKMYDRIRRVEYHVPPTLNISPQCQDLLKRILVADPAVRITIPDIQRHPWYVQNLPPGVLEMNDVLDPVPEWAQPEQEIRRILEEARRPVGPGAALRPVAGPLLGPSQPQQQGPNYLDIDDMVDEALMNPSQSDAAILYENDMRS